MMRRRRTPEQTGRTDRWKREDEAPRLRDLFPNLRELRLETDDMQDGRSTGGARCVRPIVVSRAGALFEIPCTDSKCEGGGHDITDAVLRGLEHGDTTLSGEDPCRGTVGNNECKRVLRFVVTASWQ